ncbi:hypothetical protein [Roseibium album]|uniref:Uncharacterized protein n=1 Tax=Roseibium album TaxID=311410 RepID=A0A0M6ZLM4_9HYPH|nr:hypothetical protein [Roseibium album]CTQ63496.1 hypothetical protein LA5094_06295 [Roseibium album]CTQ63658.1 hypothetical protein LA5095_00003 [Roseibium album]CTQ72187.1 hypothetical protein LA5096_03145 [Roseibium album]
MSSNNTERSVGSPFLRLNRPQYANMPEILVSSLTWGIVERARDRESVSLKVDGNEEPYEAIAFDRYDISKPKNLRIGFTRPRQDTERWEKLVESLRSDLDIPAEQAKVAAEILLDDLRALRPAKAKSYAAVPVSLGTSLLQDRSGLLRTPGPANYAAILERMYVLGGGEGSASRKLVQLFGGEGETITPWLDDALEAGAPEFLAEAKKVIISECEGPDVAVGGLQPLWLQNESTPYAWFARSWDMLCHDGWIERMPRRRWTDWAACILRNALGLGFLFEMNLLRALALGVVTNEEAEAVARAALSKSRPLLRWNDEARVSERSVKEQIETTVIQGTASLSVLDKWIKQGCPRPAEFDDDSNGLANWIQNARDWSAKQSTASLEAQIAEAFERSADDLRSSRGSSKNVRETVMYALTERSDAPGSRDLYSLLRLRGRYHVIDPGQEWLVVLSSLSTGMGQGVARVADIDGALRALCLRPGITALVDRLEDAGLARGSHDADEAIEVKAAF